MLNRLKLFFLVLFLESAGVAGFLALRWATEKGAWLLGFGRFHLLLLAAMLAAAVILAVITFLFWKKASLQSRLVEWFTTIRNNPTGFQRAILISSVGTIVSSLLLLSGIFFLQDYQSIVMRVLPILAFIVLACFEALILLVVEADSGDRYVWIGRSVLLILLGFLMLSYLRGVFDFSRLVNRTPGGVVGATDQLAQMRMMADAHQSPLTYIGDGERMPLFSSIETIFYNPQASYQDSFNRAKTVNIYLSILVLAGLFLFFQITWKSLFTTVNLVLIAAFEVFIFKAAYFLPEVLFYFLGFLSFVFLASLFVRPTYKNAMAAGLITTLAYLAKETALASVGFFTVVWCFAILVKWFPPFQAGHGEDEVGRGDEEKASHTSVEEEKALKPGKLILIGGTALVVFLGLLIPFGLKNSQKFGGFFNNINSSMEIWGDSMIQDKQVEAKYGSVIELMKSPALDRPSLQTYIRTHSLADVFKRFSRGFDIQLKNVLYPFNVVNYPLMLLAILAAVAGIYYQRTRKLLIRYKGVLLFALSYFLGYFVLYCWSGVIDKGPRFVLGLFLPLLFSIYTGLFQYKDKLVPGIKRFSILNALNVLLILLICIDSYIVLTSYLLSAEFGF